MNLPKRAVLLTRLFVREISMSEKIGLNQHLAATAAPRVAPYPSDCRTTCCAIPVRLHHVLHYAPPCPSDVSLQLLRPLSTSLGSFKPAKKEKKRKEKKKRKKKV